jgi:hypothetical protein
MSDRVGHGQRVPVGPSSRLQHAHLLWAECDPFGDILVRFAGGRPLASAPMTQDLGKCLDFSLHPGAAQPVLRFPTDTLFLRG